MRQNQFFPTSFKISNYELSAPALVALMMNAGQAVMEIYNSADIHVDMKADDSPVTAADHRAHEVLVAGLSNLGSDVAIVSEESTSSWMYRQQSAPYWLLDPLDGTKEFIAKNGEFTINVALIDGSKPLFGMVLVPASGELYIGGESLGAWKLAQQGWRSISVSKPPDTIRIMASKSHLNAETQAIIDRYNEPELLQAGSSLKFCRIAEGCADLYPRLAPTCEWDTAAAQAILEGAGGGVYQLSGQSLVYSKSAMLNPSFIAVGDKSLVHFPITTEQSS